MDQSDQVGLGVQIFLEPQTDLMGPADLADSAARAEAAG